MFGQKRWRLFRLLGNDVYMTPSFLVVLVIFALIGVNNLQQLQSGLLWIPILFIGVLLHELGHAIASHRLGYGNSEIVFWGLGGLAINRYAGRRDPRKQIAIALAGPLVSLLLGVASGGALYALEGGITYTSYFGQFLYLMMWVNLVWAVFNMLPIHPMDGGQATLNALRLMLKKERQAIRWTAYLSLGALALSLVGYSAYFKTAPSLFLILLAAYFGYMNVQLLRDGTIRPMMA